MKKSLRILIVFIIALSFFISFSYAEDDICKIGLTSDTTTLKPGDYAELNILISNIKTTNGIFAMGGFLQYNSEIFEIKGIEDEEIKNEIRKITELEDFEILYIGNIEKEDEVPWYMIAIEGETKGTMAILGSSLTDPQISEQEIVTISLEVKEGVGSTNTQVNLTDLETIDAAETRYPLTKTSSIEYNINGNTENNNDSNNNDNNNTTYIYDEQNGDSIKIAKDNVAKTETPYTGVEDAIIPSIFITAIIGTVSFIKYLKYRYI